jgi:predicted transcriptional regulator
MKPIVTFLYPTVNKTELVLDGRIGADISEVRRTLKISQKALASEMKMKQSQLCDLEQGRRRWTMALFNTASEALRRLCAN